MLDHEPIFLSFSVDSSVEDDNDEKVDVQKEAAGMLTEIFTGHGLPQYSHKLFI